MNYRGRRDGLKRSEIIMIVVVAIWATQVLLHQWGYGAVAAGPAAAGGERFVPASPEASGAVVEVQGETTIVGDAIRLRHVIRWAEADRATMEPLADVVVAKLGQGIAFRAMSVDEVKQAMRDAGANLGLIRFTGATTCTVSRSDVTFGEGAALRQWVQAKDAGPEGVAAVAAEQRADDPVAMTAAPATRQAVEPTAVPMKAAEPDFHRLRDMLVADLAERLNLPVDSLQVRFRAEDERFLRLVKPLFQFTIEPRKGRGLGDIGWDVSIVTDSGTKQRVAIGAVARAVQVQLVAAKPLSAGQVIRDEDVTEKSVLIDRLPDEPLAVKGAVIGQQLARDIPAGTALTSRMIEAVPLVRTGQLVSVTVQSGGVQVKTVAEAREAGAFGQVVRVRKPGTRDEFNVVITGPQAARMVIGGNDVIAGGLQGKHR